MCGIVGYVGPRNATPVIYDGLKRLEYRGYDSAGIAVIQNDRVEVRRDAGKLDALRDLLSTSPIAGPIGIGHTRWATHGKANRLNAHPHLDCTGDLVVIHNGIVENFLELRRELDWRKVTRSRARPIPKRSSILSKSTPKKGNRLKKPRDLR